MSLLHRLTHAVCSAVAIALLGWWSWYSDPDPNLSEIMAQPANFEGREIKIGEEPLLEAVESEYFVVRARGFRFRVAGKVSPADVGRFVFVRGVFHPATNEAECDGVISPAEYRVARGRHAKIWVSVIPVIWMAVLLLRHFRVNTTRWSIEPRT